MALSRRDFIGSSTAFAVAGCIGIRPSEKPVVRFGFITDCHYAAHLGPTKPGDLRMYSRSLGKLRDFVAEMNRQGADFVVEGGDFKDRGRTASESLAYLDEMERAFAEFEGDRFHVLGNHDHDNLSKDEFLAHVSNAGQREAQAYYAFERAGVKFIVLDACNRADGTPYCRGNFSWKEAFIPERQLAFLRRELDSAMGPCVPIVHQQLDAEDITCIRNAEEVRRILEASGKVKCVIQGHTHQGGFHELNGIGYYTAAASVIGEKTNAYAVVEVYPSGGVRILGHDGASSLESTSPASHPFTLSPFHPFTLSHGWRPGHYQVHYIFTGRGESTFHIFPDGTSMLLDVGDTMRFYHTAKETPHLPDITRRAGEWVARYVERVNPKGRKVDYFHLSHYHEDHGGGERYHGERIHASTGDYWLCGLADAARFLEFGRVVDRAWPGFDDPTDAITTCRDGTPRNIRAVYAALQAKGTEIERFRLGATDQIHQLDEEAAHPGFHIFNLCANGRYVRKDGTVRDLYLSRVRKGEKSFNENGMSCGMIITYGAFRYFTAGDFSDSTVDELDRKVRTEDELAEAVGPVDVAKMNHHGHHSMFPKLVKGLQARVWTSCVLDQAHCTDDTMNRLADRTSYAGDRTFIPTYMPLRGRRPIDYVTYLPDVAKPVIDEPCHVILDVPPGGETYTLACVSAATEEPVLKAQYGFFAKPK